MKHKIYLKDNDYVKILKANDESNTKLLNDSLESLKDIDIQGVFMIINYKEYLSNSEKDILLATRTEI